MRTISALITAATLVATLASCSATGSAGAACDAPAVPGNASTIVTASGAFSADPSAKFPRPLISTRMELSVITEGDGATVYPGDVADIQATLYDATTGDAVTSTGYDSTSPLRTVAGDNSSIFSTVVQCASVGSRIVITTDAQAIAETNPADTPVVLVIDVVNRFLGKANGVDQLPEAGLPAVVLAPSGQPGIVIPNAAPPTALDVAVLKRGDGETVADGDKVVLNYTGMLWDTSEVFDSSWTSGLPASFAATAGAGGLIPGFATALIGQKVGSQVIAVIPPALGYGDAGTQGVPAGATLVFVFDVLGIQK